MCIHWVATLASINTAPVIPSPLQRVEIFGQCQVILRKCEDLLKRSGAAVRHDLHKLYSSLANIWTMSAKSKQLTQVRAVLLFLPPSSHSPPPILIPPPPHLPCITSSHLLPPSPSSQLCQQVEEVLTRQIPPLRASLLSSAKGSMARDTPLTSPSAPPLIVTPPGWPRPPPGPGGRPSSPYQPSPSSPYQPSPNSHAAQPQVTVVLCPFLQQM